MEEKLYLKVDFDKLSNAWLEISRAETIIRFSHDSVEIAKNLDVIREYASAMREMVFLSETAK